METLSDRVGARREFGAVSRRQRYTAGKFWASLEYILSGLRVLTGACSKNCGMIVGGCLRES